MRVKLFQHLYNGFFHHLAFIHLVDIQIFNGNSANCSLLAGESTKDFLSCALTAQKEKMQAIKPATKYLVYFIINLFSFLQAKTESHLYRIAIIPSQ